MWPRQAHFSRAPRPATMVTALVKSALSEVGVTKDIPPKRIVQKSSPRTLYSHPMRGNSLTTFGPTTATGEERLGYETFASPSDLTR